MTIILSFSYTNKWPAIITERGIGFHNNLVSLLWALVNYTEPSRHWRPLQEKPLWYRPLIKQQPFTSNQCCNYGELSWWWLLSKGSCRLTPDFFTRLQTQHLLKFWYHEAYHLCYLSITLFYHTFCKHYLYTFQSLVSNSNGEKIYILAIYNVEFPLQMELYTIQFCFYSILWQAFWKISLQVHISSDVRLVRFCSRSMIVLPRIDNT